MSAAATPPTALAPYDSHARRRRERFVSTPYLNCRVATGKGAFRSANTESMQAEPTTNHLSLTNNFSANEAKYYGFTVRLPPCFFSAGTSTPNRLHSMRSALPLLGARSGAIFFNSSATVA